MNIRKALYFGYHRLAGSKLPSGCYVEIVDEAGKRVPAGSEGNIAVTCLNNLAMPLIRYQIGDRGTLAAEATMCPCGRKGQILGGIIFVDDIPNIPSGKYRYILSEVSAQLIISLDLIRKPRNEKCTKNKSVQGSKQQFAVMAIGSFDTESQGQSTTITQDAPFGSLFAAISGSGSDGGLGERGFHRRTIHALLVPGDAFQFMVVFQLGLPQALKEALRFPVSKAVVDGTRCSQLAGQRIQLNARSQHIHDGRKHLSIICGWTAFFRVGRTFWNQGSTRFHNSSLTSQGRVRTMLLFHLFVFVFIVSPVFG